MDWVLGIYETQTGGRWVLVKRYLPNPSTRNKAIPFTTRRLILQSCGKSDRVGMEMENLPSDLGYRESYILVLLLLLLLLLVLVIVAKGRMMKARPRKRERERENKSHGRSLRWRWCQTAFRGCMPCTFQPRLLVGGNILPLGGKASPHSCWVGWFGCFYVCKCLLLPFAWLSVLLLAS